MLKNRKILLGITGGIACYKSAELVRLLVKNQAIVHVVMTEHARQFVSPLTFQTLSENPVLTDMFDYHNGAEIKHISIPQESDITVIAPATANILGKMANGIADDLLSTMVLATKAPILLVPSMNLFMWENRIVQKNIQKLKESGYRLMEPEEGFLACGYEGKGRMPEPADILNEIISILKKKDLKNKKVLLSAGPTREFFDPIRFISNPSTGKMGFSLAREAIWRGADVILVSGPTTLTPPVGCRFIQVESANEMHKKITDEAKNASIIIMSAAVSDYMPEKSSREKEKKGAEKISLNLVKTRDILAELGRNKGRKILVGFAAETNNPEENAKKKLHKKNLDMIVLNKVNEAGSGFGSETNKVTLLFRNGKILRFDTMAKSEVAKTIFDAIADANLRK